MRASNERKNKVSGMIEINQNQGFLSPASYESADEDIGLFLKQKFAKLHHRQKEQWIKNAVHNLYGRHNVIDYKEQYNFRQKWEQSSKPTYFQSKQSLIKTQNLMPTCIQIVLLMLYAGTIWFLTIYRLFQTINLINMFVPWIIITQIKDVLLKMYFIKKAIQEDHDVKARLACYDYIKLHWSNILFLPYAAFIILQIFYDQTLESSFFIFIDFFFIWRAYLRLTELYDGIKIRIMASKFRNELQVIQLLARCFYVVHFIGIILYYVSMQNTTVNWALRVNDFNNDWTTRYIYSLYFASTTLTTVGYGDITPQNVIEIITVLFIQIFGIINFGYIINQIGRILAKINEKQQILTKNISQAENIAETYKIPEALALQMRNYIINNQIAHDQLNIEEEDNFMRKLNDQIRQGFNSLNQIRIIKSSIFFLCHWTKKFQRGIASKLIRNIYSPQQSLLQVQGKQKLYILTRGKIDVFACLIDRSLLITIRPLKVIEIEAGKQVHNNTYGYSSLISGLQINLKAVVKDYSICYSLTKQDFLNAIMEDQRDFEYFHQIKSKIQQSYHKQIWQAPNINNTREHYLPNPNYILIKKRHMAKAQQSKRKERNRKYKKTKCYIQAEILASSQQIISEPSSVQSCNSDNLLQKMMRQPLKIPENQLLSEKQRKLKYENILNENRPYLIKSRGYNQKKQKKNSFEDQIEKKKHEDKIIKETILNNFQENYQFNSYFPKANMKKMLQRYQKIYHKRVFIDINSIKSQKSQKLQTMNQIPQDIMRKLLNIRVFGSQNLD